MKKLAVLTTHPIQYNAPLFKLLAQRARIEVKVFYTWGEDVLKDKFDPGFGKVITWDIPLLQGYPYQFLKNDSEKPGSDHFKGISNPDVIEQLDAWHPDALLIYGWSYKSHLAVMRHYKGKTPIFFRGDSTMLDEQPAIKSFIRMLTLRWVYRHLDKAFYVGTNNKEYFRRCGLRERQLLLAPHAINNHFFAENDEEVSRRALVWRKELGIGENDFVFLFAGKLEPKKSPLLLLEAFKKAQFPKTVHLVIVGNGELEQQMRSGAKGYPVHFLGFQNQTAMPAVYRLAECVVLPSGGPGETWGLAINEAMASGRPVIASTKCGGAIDLIREGRNGYIFTAGNAEELKATMQKAVNNKNIRSEMRRQAREDIQSFSLDRVAAVIEEAMLTESEHI